MPDPQPPQPYDPPSDFFIRIIETIAGLCVVCILTLAFMSPLHWPGKISLCIFSLTLPVMVAVRIDIANAPSSGSLLHGNFDDFARAGACAAIAGFIFLLLDVFWPAAILFATVCATLVILAPEPKRTENQPNPSPPPPDDVQTDN